MSKEQKYYDILYGQYTVKKKTTKRKLPYKGKYNRLFPSKISSTAFLTICALYSINARGMTYGLQIIDDVLNMNRPTKAPIWKPTHGIMYPLLNDLVKEGYIKKVNTDEIDDFQCSDKRRKVYYAMTELGKVKLKNILEEYKEMLFNTTYFFNKIVNQLYPTDSYKNMILNIVKEL